MDLPTVLNKQEQSSGSKASIKNSETILLVDAVETALCMRSIITFKSNRCAGGAFSSLLPALPHDPPPPDPPPPPPLPLFPPPAMEEG
eukprot:1158529-Pelagomonas_calceolata.AAC.15